MGRQLSVVIEMIIAKTQKWGDENGSYNSEPEHKSPPASPKARAIADVLDDTMEQFDHQFDEDQVMALATIVELIIGEEVPIKKQPSSYDANLPNKIMVVPLENGNGHNYELHKACLSIGNNQALNADGSLGNYLPTGRADIRPATQEEIEKFFSRVSKDALKAYGIM
ncbi:hypothetical protein ACFL08_02260 [Patescibacteria group bacterium]